MGGTLRHVIKVPAPTCVSACVVRTPAVWRRGFSGKEMQKPFAGAEAKFYVGSLILVLEVLHDRPGFRSS